MGGGKEKNAPCGKNSLSPLDIKINWSTSQKQYLIVSSAESQNARLAATSAELRRSLMLCPYLVASLATSHKYATGIFIRQSVDHF